MSALLLKADVPWFNPAAAVALTAMDSEAVTAFDIAN